MAIYICFFYFLTWNWIQLKIQFSNSTGHIAIAQQSCMSSGYHIGQLRNKPFLLFQEVQLGNTASAPKGKAFIPSPKRVHFIPLCSEAFNSISRSWTHGIYWIHSYFLSFSLYPPKCALHKHLFFSPIWKHSRRTGSFPVSLIQNVLPFS